MVEILVMMYGKLVDRKVVQVKNILEWSNNFNSEDKIVAKTKVGDAEVSTVFLGIAFSTVLEEPRWFETMVFGGEHDGEQRRYPTWEDAAEGHKLMVKYVKGEIDGI